MTATEIIETYEIPPEFHEAIFKAYEADAEDMMLRSVSAFVRHKIAEQKT